VGANGARLGSGIALVRPGDERLQTMRGGNVSILGQPSEKKKDTQAVCSKGMPGKVVVGHSIDVQGAAMEREGKGFVPWNYLIASAAQPLGKNSVKGKVSCGKKKKRAGVEP